MGFSFKKGEKLQGHFYSKTHPSSSFQEAKASFEELQQSEARLPLASLGGSRLFSHGEKTERVFVLLHGLTTCPEQFVPLAKILFDSGANVIIPRAKYAGFSDLMNEQQGTQTAQDLIDQASIGLDIAGGLGHKITLVGISAAGVASAWMAEHREGIDHVVLISPFLGAYGYSSLEADIIAFFFDHLPNHYFWKNKLLKAAMPDPSYVYPRYGTKSIGSILELGKSIRAFHGNLQTHRLDIILSSCDNLVNNDLTKQQVKKWTIENPGKVFEYEFSKEKKLPHDCIDPKTPHSNVEASYPKILEILTVASDPV